MFEEHRYFKAPANKNAKIWRYLDFTKFVDLLHTKSLYFTRSDKFDDHFEGSFPKNIEAYKQLTIKQFNFSKEDADKHFSSERIKARRKAIAINCWHLNEYESAAMWRLYLKSNEGIAIQSTYDRLAKSFAAFDKSVFIGIVTYIDYDREMIDYTCTFDRFLHKRLSFQHEQELRAIIWDPSSANAIEIVPIAEHGVKIPVAIDTLIEKIYVAPGSPMWFSELVQSVIDKYEINALVETSKIDERPVF